MLLEMNYINVEAAILPNIPLSNVEIDDAVKQLLIPNFRGCYCINILPKLPHRMETGILNLDNSKGDGTHWTAWLRNTNKKMYFDSYGLQPPIELIKYLGASLYYNTDCIQPRDTVVCGHLCLYVLKRLSNGDEFQDLLNSLI
jgi:hypothetical protein